MLFWHKLAGPWALVGVIWKCIKVGFESCVSLRVLGPVRVDLRLGMSVSVREDVQSRDFSEGGDDGDEGGDDGCGGDGGGESGGDSVCLWIRWCRLYPLTGRLSSDALHQAPPLFHSG
jgi:hypothetical protein